MVAVTEDRADRATEEVEAKLTKRIVTDSHKAAMAAGRNRSRVVDRYLTTLQTNRPKRGRQRTPETIQSRLEKIQAVIGESSPAKQIVLTSEIKSLQDELAIFEKVADHSKLEEEFVQVAKDFSEDRKISKALWKEFGVPADILERAGIE